MGERRRRLSAAWGVCIALALATPASAQDVESDQESDTEPEEVSLFGYTKDEGFRLRSEDGNYRLQIAMRAGLELEPAWTEGDGRVNEALAFLRPVLRGNLFREWLGFTFSMELAANDPFVLDAFVDIAPWEAAVWTQSGWLFVAAILDLYSRRVVGWATSANNDRALALDALRAALVARQPPPGLLHHSDRGSPYASGEYRRALARAGAVASMSRKGDCWDNAVAESFFATLKTEALGDLVPGDHDAATRLLGEYIDGYYNAKRRHSFLGYESPIEFELKSQLAAMAA